MIKRWTPTQAKGHPFITGEPYTEPYIPPPPPSPLPLPKPSPRTSISNAGSLGFYPPSHSIQNFPPIPPPIVPNSNQPSGSNNSNNNNNNNSGGSKKNANTALPANLGMFNKQDFSQSPADNYSPRGYHD